MAARQAPRSDGGARPSQRLTRHAAAPANAPWVHWRRASQRSMGQVARGHLAARQPKRSKSVGGLPANARDRPSGGVPARAPRVRWRHAGHCCAARATAGKLAARRPASNRSVGAPRDGRNMRFQRKTQSRPIRRNATANPRSSGQFLTPVAHAMYTCPPYDVARGRNPSMHGGRWGSNENFGRPSVGALGENYSDCRQHTIKISMSQNSQIFVDMLKVFI